MVGNMIIAALAKVTVAQVLASAWLSAAAFAVNFAVSNILSRAFAPDASSGQAVDNGVRQQVPPSSTNSIPVVYGDAYMGGAFVDAALSTDAKTMYYVLAISHISPNGEFVFDTENMYWGDRKITFSETDATAVIGLTDGAGNYDTSISEKTPGDRSSNLYIALYKSTENGVITSVNGASLPSVFMGGSDIPAELRWSATNRQMNGLAFAIVKMYYNRDAETTSMQTLTYHVSHYLNGAGCAKPGDVWYDYMVNQQYGCAMPVDIVDSTSVAALNAYSDELIPYTDSVTGLQYQPRYRINGVIDTGQSCLNNINSIMIVCDSWNQYNAAKGQWSIVVNKANTAAYAFDDSLIIGEIRVSAYDITSSVNQVEAEFPSAENRDQSDFVYYETPAELLYPNEPINKQSVQFSMTNNSVQAQYLATRILEQAREDLIVSFSTAYPGIQVDAGDVVTVTNSSYGWTNKPFRVMRVSEVSLPDGNLGASFELNEYNAQVYDDKDITKYVPAPNTDLADPSFFGTLSAPTVVSSSPTAAVPSFKVQPYMGAAGFVTYAEVWYSAFSNPTAAQLYFGSTTSVLSNGVPYSVGQTLPTVDLQIPAGSWYLFYRLANPAAISKYSPASTVFNWKPTTVQYTNRWIAVAYADNATGTFGFSTNPRNKSYYGLFNNTTANGSTNPADYTWYEGNFGTSNYLLIANRSNRKFSFAVGNAGFNNLGGTFVPSETSVYDTSVWGALQDGEIYIDLDARTGQLTTAGTTAVSSADGLLSVSNNTNGSMVVKLQKFLNFGSGVYQKTVATTDLTIDIYGRVVGYTNPDQFFYTNQVFTATAGQTVISFNHIVGYILVWRDGILMQDTADYSETSTTITFVQPLSAGEIIDVVFMKAVSSEDFTYLLFTSSYAAGPNELILAYVNPDISTVSVVYDDLGNPYNIYGYDEFTNTLYVDNAYVMQFQAFYAVRPAGTVYPPFTVYYETLTNATSVFAGETNSNGFEQLYINGVALSEVDYDIDSSGIVSGFPAPVTGVFTSVIFSANSFGVPACNILNTPSYSINGTLYYPFQSNPLALTLFANGVRYAIGVGKDYTATAQGFTLATAINNNFTLLNNQTYARDGAA